MAVDTINSDLTFRMATESDLIAIIKILADDPLGALREKIALSPRPIYGHSTESKRQQSGIDGCGN